MNWSDDDYKPTKKMTQPLRDMPDSCSGSDCEEGNTYLRNIIIKTTSNNQSFTEHQIPKESKQKKNQKYTKLLLFTEKHEKQQTERKFHPRLPAPTKYKKT